ncbi:Hemicentin-1,Coadhesin,Thrombospondin-2,Thrombospondin-1,Mucin-like protein [Mytilus edulis]|uniref:Hemicentin-1,Coadhesin,Thrombospondin-2,Thrombosp ondin-1,Mucin-like protein n=1 Tax=Mytilus edulis TaxID=6550 RepID=A0A8S3T5E4_MYTED|nr:Hemicentin-1,Coadhesin,Thrombospondin-2,Thrombospondin-1,Mucin-like protein [Mytilus edulis]
MNPVLIKFKIVEQLGSGMLASTSVNGGWSLWDSWGACTISCGTGLQSRGRTCDNPAPENNEGTCQGSGSEYKACTLPACPVDGGWSSWESLGACNVTCGTGQQRKRRNCNNPDPANGGANCQGEDFDYTLCSLPSCSVDGGWSFWISGVCNVTCGSGQQSRRRYCNNPSQANGGADCHGEEDDIIACTRSECTDTENEREKNKETLSHYDKNSVQKTAVRNTPIVVGTVISVLVIVMLILILIIYAKRRWYKSKKEPDYDITDMTKVKSHIYGKTHVNHAYQNEQQSAEYINEAHLVERYDVSELTKRCQNKENFLQSLKAEFRLLNNSTDDSKPFNSQYEIVNTGLRQDVNQLHLDSSTLDVLYTDNVSILLEPPQKDIADQFWTIVDNQCVENIILLAKGNEKMSEFYPMLDDVMRINNFEIYLDSAERMNKHIMLLIFNLQNKTTQSIRQIRMFKTNVSEYPTVKILCFVMDKASEIRGVPVLIINSEMADLSVCGVLTVCLNAIYAIKNGSLFSVLGNATMASKNNSSFFKNFDDYELCYKVLENYLEAVHTYDFID